MADLQTAEAPGTMETPPVTPSRESHNSSLNAAAFLVLDPLRTPADEPASLALLKLGELLEFSRIQVRDSAEAHPAALPENQVVTSHVADFWDLR